MEIESFLKKSEGDWISMRSGHSLAFKQFEEVVSNIKIKILNKNESRVINFLDKSNYTKQNLICPFEIKWEGNSNWQEGHSDKELSGYSRLIPIPYSLNTGVIWASVACQRGPR